MKEIKKYKPLGQYIFENHDLEYSTDEFLEKTAPFIGFIVHSFNSLEEELNSRICYEINDRADTMGVIVIHKMSFSQKVDLYTRIIRSKELTFEKEFPSFSALIADLKKCGELRNAVVHAEWENMDSQGYTYVNMKFNKKGWEQEYQQFTVESLEAIDAFIHQTYLRFGDLEDEMNDLK
jgi:hypothetical protein